MAISMSLLGLDEKETSAFAALGGEAWLRDVLRRKIAWDARFVAQQIETAADDTIAAWLDERCVLGPTMQVLSGESYRDYKAWAEANGELVRSPKGFTLGLVAAGFRR